MIMKKKIITYCLGIGLTMFFPEYYDLWEPTIELIKNQKL